MAKRIGESKLRYAGVAALASALLVVGQAGVSTPQDAGALSKPTDTPDALSPSGFLPAPNEDPYCDSMEYFNYFPKNVEAVEKKDNIAVDTDTAWTNEDNTGISMKFTTVRQSPTQNGQGGTPSGKQFTPMTSFGTTASNGGLSTIGIIMNGDYDPAKTSQAKVELSEPLFYSQWVFTDLDQNLEGFDLNPYWVSPDPQYNRYGMYGPANGAAPGWSFATATPSDPSHAGFYSLRSQNVDGYQLPGRFQVDFYGPITGMDMARYGSGGSGFATGAGCPPVGISKQVTQSKWNPTTQKFEVQYLISVINNLPSQSVLNQRVAAAEAKAFQSLIVGGNALAIDQTDVKITDALDLTGFTGVEITSLTSSAELTVNPAYDGVSDTNLVTGSDTLVAGGTGEIVLDVAYSPDFTNPEWNDCGFESKNQSKISAVAAGVPVEDVSDNGSDPKPASNNGTGGTDDPTPVSFGTLACQVGLAKDIVDGSTINNGDGTYTATYDFKVGNYGQVNLTNFVLDDDLQTAYGDAYVSHKTTLDECNALNATGGLAPGAFCMIKIDVVFKPISGILDPWINQASVTATIGPDPKGTGTTSDDSQDGTNPDPDGDGDPTNNTEPTPNEITARIGLAKRVTEGPLYNGDLTYDVTYKLVATNYGFAYLDKIVVDDDLKATFGDALVSYTSDDQCADAVLPKNGDSCEVTVNVTFKPDGQVHWENSATVTGNAGGTEVKDVSQDGVDPDPDGDGDPGNNSDPTPVDVGFVDLALRKVSAPDADTTPAVGDNHTFNVEVYNQGDVAVKDIELVDYLPNQVVLKDDAWTDNGDGTANYMIAGPLAPGESIIVPITVTVVDVEISDTAATNVDNYSEIVSQVPIDADGETIVDENGAVIKDIDSTPDAVFGNDVRIDNEIDLTPETGDEDDEDIARVVVEIITPPSSSSTTTTTTVISPPRPKTGGSISTALVLGALLTAAGFFLVSLRRRTPTTDSMRLPK